MTNFITRNSSLFVLGTLLLIACWKIVSLVMSSASLVPSPEESLFAFINIISTPQTATDIFSTFMRGMIGFIFAFVIALLFGLIAGSVPGFRSFFKPLLITLRSTPVVAFILLLLIWFETNRVPVIIAFITMFPIIYTNIVKGMQEVDGHLSEMMHVYQVPRLTQLRSVYFPSISAYLFSGVSTALGFGWRAIVIGEVLSQPTYGIGSRMRESYGYFEVKEVISWAVLAILLSFVLETLVSLLEKHTLKWKRD